MKTNSKKAEISSEVVLIIPKIIFIIAVIFSFVILVKILIVSNINVKGIESQILVNRILFSKDSISYFDADTERLYPGIIDLKFFETLSKANPNVLDISTINYYKDNPIIAAKLTLKIRDKSDIVAYYNKEMFDRWEPRVLPEIKGGGGSVKAFKEKKYILVKDDLNLIPAVLEFFIIS